MSDIEDYDSIYSESSDEDEEVILHIPKIKNENYLDQTVANYDNSLFIEHFRVSREVENNIAEKYTQSDLFNNHSGQYGQISAFDQVLIFLWFIGHQTCSFRDVSDRFNIALSSLNRIIKRLTIFLSNLSTQIITWPSDIDKENISNYFQDLDFSGAIGAVDGCRIKIDKPNIDPDSYINRKGFYSIQMQVVCDHTRMIRDIFVGYPGSVHDSRVFNLSPLGLNLRRRCGQYYLLGDSGYPLKPNLMTPFRDNGHLTREQIYYNVKLSKNRYIIEHWFGILKQKFRQLYHIKLRNIEYIVHFIRAACVLHNLARNDDDELILNEARMDDHNEIEGLGNDEIQQIDADGRRIRDGIVDSLRNVH